MFTSCKKKLLSALAPAGTVILPLPVIVLYHYLAHNKNKIDQDGFDQEGYDRDGYDRYGYNKDGFSRHGFDAEGYDTQGYNSFGINRAGYSKDEQYLLWQKQNKEWFAALTALYKKRYDKAFLKLKEIQKCILTYICKMERCDFQYSAQKSCIKAMTDACYSAGILDYDLAKSLNEFRDLFSRSTREKMRYSSHALTATTNLMNLWEEQYIKPYHTSFYK